MSNKYGNRKVSLDGYTFDSQREATCYRELYLLQEAGEISGLTLQPTFTLADAVRYRGKRQKPALRYRADFEYRDNRTGERVVLDVKGVRTTAFVIKKHLMMSVYGIEVEEI